MNSKVINMILLAILVIIFLFILILILFSFPQFSPIPYFPSNKKDWSIILTALDLKNNHIIVDLGAGDGWIIFEGAREALKKKLNTKFVAVELNPVLIFILHIRRLLNLNRKNIKIIHGDMFKMNFSQFLTSNFSLLTYYLYVSPRFLYPLAKKIQKETPEASIVSYFYPIPNLKKKEKQLEGKHNVFIYS